jgi:hypothetical protein
MNLPINDGRARLPLEMQAYYVWCGASSGRQYARSDDADTRLRAYARLEHLARVTNEKFPSLTRVAQDAARDIHNLLSWHERGS